jgi:hypothetical protein
MTQRVECESRFAYTEDGGEPAIQLKYFFGGAGMPHSFLLGELFQIWREMAPSAD